TRAQSMETMRQLLREFIMDPGVNMQITNFRVTVIGVVRNPGSLTLPEERVTILEALALAGDLTTNRVRTNVLVSRGVEGNDAFTRVVLPSPDLVHSPAYFLRQNDVIYVEPNKAQINSSSYSRNTSVIISIASLLITVIALIAQK